MDNLQNFLNPTATQYEEDVLISDRFKTDDGVTLRFKIKTITQKENKVLLSEATTKEKIRGQYIEKLNTGLYQSKLVIKCTLSPDFTNTELCQGYGTLNPVDLLEAMLLPGEFALLSDKIIMLNGFEKDFTSLEDEVKN